MRLCRRLAVLALGALASCGDRRELRVAVASSLRELFAATAPAFERLHPDTVLRGSFDASSTLARQIEAGAPLAVFLSADADTVTRIQDRLEAATITRFLGNRLALVGRAGLARVPRSPEELAEVPGRIALAGPAVPAGKYARACLAQKRLLEPLAARVVNADNVRATLALVESGAADFAFVYTTDAAIARHAVLLWTAPAADDPGIVYVAAAVAGAPHPRAREYVRWLLSDEFQAQAAALGFTVRPQ